MLNFLVDSDVEVEAEATACSADHGKGHFEQRLEIILLSVLSQHPNPEILQNQNE